jgi:GcrA cell cycle regulator
MPRPHPPGGPAAGPSALVRHRGSWDDLTVETLTTLWAQGDLSAADIARRLGVSRNAVLGKVHRLGLSNRRPPRLVRKPKPTAPRRPNWTRSPSPRRSRAQPLLRRSFGGEATPSPSPAPRDELPGLVAHLEDLPPRTCHWPVGDPADPGFCFCGREADPGPYCLEHDRVAHRLKPSRPLKVLAALLDA